MYVRGEYETLYINDLRFKVEKRIRIAPDTSRIVFFFFFSLVVVLRDLFDVLYIYINHIILLTVLILNSDRGKYIKWSERENRLQQIRARCSGALVQWCNCAYIHDQ